MSLSNEYLCSTVAAMEARGISFSPGLTQQELVRQQQACDIVVPPDLVEFLCHAVPTGEGFPDWRGHADDLRSWIEQPLRGILFDIEFNQFWPASWGTRPDDLTAACEVATTQVEAAPTLIPIYMHRFIPSAPADQGNPVYSVHQTDIIVYGRNLQDYLCLEFGAPSVSHQHQPVRRIPFWSEMVDLNSEIG